MEESIRRVEKLVHATNSALAQMKYSLMFDDLGDGLEVGGGKPRKKDSSGPKFLDGEDLRLCQDEFKSEAEDMLARMDKLFRPKEVSHRNRSKTLQKIKEINNKLMSRKPDPPETKLSRQKLLALINQDLTPASKASEDKPPALKLEKLPTPKETVRKSSAKSKEELKSKILETRETVDRGFQTARQLSQKVECMRKKTPSECDAKKSESTETLKSRCEKCAERRRMKRLKKEMVKEQEKVKEVEKVKEGNVKEGNVCVIEVKDTRVPSLSIQRLPSLHIKDGLRMQKVHNLAIPAGDSYETVNTRNIILTHEDIEKEKREKALDQLRLHCLFSDDKSNYVECFNCGKLNKTRGRRVDPKRVDDVLRMCNFNVFDPRIDEFVEKCNPEEWIQEEEPVKDNSSEQTVIEKSHRKTRKLQEMSEHLTQLYKIETENLEDNHLKLDNILQSLFRRVDESREVFEECRLLKRRPDRLTMTKPVVVSLDSTRKKMDKKDVKNRNKSRTKKPEEVTSSGSTSSDEPEFILRPNETKKPPVFLNDSSEAKPSQTSRKPSSATRTNSRPPRRIFRKTSKRLSKTKMQKTSEGKSQKVDEKPALSTSSSSTSTKTANLPKVGKAQIVNKQFEACSTKPETDENKINKTPEMNPVMSSGEKSPLKEKEFTFVTPLDFSFEKLEVSVSEVQREKSPSSLSSELMKESKGRSKSPKSEKSDDYESDFERESEAEGDQKLSTILEVNSEPEKKQATASQGTTPTELVTSLKEILSALKNQFSRTETLAEKLTENVQERKDSPQVWPTDSELVINLQSARKNSKDTKAFRSPFSLVHSSRNQKSDEFSARSLSEGGSSIGEIISKRKSDGSVSENGRRSSRVSSCRRDGFQFDLGLNDDVSYSEGEIPSDILAASETNSSRSVGEVPSEKTSGASSID